MLHIKLEQYNSSIVHEQTKGRQNSTGIWSYLLARGHCLLPGLRRTALHKGSWLVPTQRVTFNMACYTLTWGTKSL